MGFLKKLQRQINTSTEIVSQNQKPIKQESAFRVHSDLNGLIWIADGPKKNYTQEKSKITSVDLGDYVLTMSFSGAQEPSLISTKAAVKMNPSSAEKLPYYPSYLELSPAQRGMYWKYLENPYNPNFEIGYVFILYYGLERHLLLGDYEKAINIIIKLRDVHKNASFQSYSANAIILTCLKNKRADLLYTFLSSLDKEYEYNFSDNLYLFSMYSLDLPLNADDVMRMAKSFEYTKTTYIKTYPDLFKETLIDNMVSDFGKAEIKCSQFIKKSEFRKLPKETVPIFANVSIIDKQIEVPLMIHAFHLKKALYDLLNKTHEDVKKHLAEMRKHGNAPQKASKEKKQAVIETFDFQKEKELLKKYQSCETGTMDEHYASIELQDFYYKYRNIDEKYLKECIKYCNDDIRKLQSINEDYIKTEKAAIINLAKATRTPKDEVERQLAEIKLFSWNIPAFKRLAIIYEKQKEFNKAAAVCDVAIRYYSIVKNQDAEMEFVDRKKKILNKQ